MDGQGTTHHDGGLRRAAKVDMHCHSTASQHSRLGVQRAVGLPECATPPEEVYELAGRRGMDFVTITDHDTISGVIEIADRPDVVPCCRRVRCASTCILPTCATRAT